MKFNLSILYAFSILVVVFIDPAFGQNSDGDAKPKPSPRQKQTSDFPGYGKYKNQLQQYCEYLQRDHRTELMGGILLKAIKDFDQGCKECRMFYKALLCPMRKKIKKGEVEQPAPIPSRIPNTEMLAVLSDVFQSISESKLLMRTTLDSMHSLRERIAANPDLKIGEREYLDILLTYIEAPFNSISSSSSSSANGGSGATDSTPQELDNLF